MLSNIRIRLTWLATLALLVLGCSEGTETQPGYAQAPKGPGIWCEASCSYTARCTNPIGGTCISSCMSANAGYFSRVKDEYLVKVATCITNATCTDWDTMTKQCYQFTAPTVPPSAAVIDFCKAMSAKFFECFYADDDLTFCAGDFAVWSDSGVTRANACVSSACSNINDCLDNAFNGTN